MSPRAKANGNGASPPSFFSRDVTEARRFYLDLNPPKEGLAVVCGGVERTTPSYGIHRESFPFYSLEYVVGGQGNLKLGKTDYVLQPGRVFSYGPGIIHHITASATEPLLKYFVDFSGTHAREFLVRAGLRPGTVMQVRPAMELQPLFEELVRCGLRGSPKSRVLCGKLLECIALKLADARSPIQAESDQAYETYLKCRHYMERNFPTLRTLNQLSAECHINGAYLCRLFQRFHRLSPYQYLLHLKMNRAAELLQSQGLLVKEAAAETGFTDPFHFSRAFKLVFGLAPEAFRKLR
jgi:AraC-like DNA-binding protein